WPAPSVTSPTWPTRRSADRPARSLQRRSPSPGGATCPRTASCWPGFACSHPASFRSPGPADPPPSATQPSGSTSPTRISRTCAPRSLLADLMRCVTGRAHPKRPEVALGGPSASSGLLERCVLCVVGGVPAGQQVERIGVPAAGCGAAHDEIQALVGGELHGLVGERQLPDERVVQALGASAVPPDFVPGPALPEGVAAGGQLADQVRQGLVVGVAADLGAQGGDVLVGDGVPVGVELGGGGVQEGEA